MSALVVINANEYDPIFCQQIFRHFQTRINHIQPIGVESSIALGIRYKTITFLVVLAAVCQVFLGALGKIVLIYKVVAGVVGRVEVESSIFRKMVCRVWHE